MDVKFVGKDDPDLVRLSEELDGFYFELYGAKYMKYGPALEGLAGAAVAYEKDEALGCCCWRAFDAVTAEVERVYVRPERRRQGAASRLMEAVELHAAQNGCHRAVLDTPVEAEDAISFYLARGYRILKTGCGAYAGAGECVCFEKEISDGTMR